MIPEKKNQAAHGALALLVLLAVLALTLRVWIMLIPLMLGLFVYGMWALVHTPEQAADAQQETTDGQTAQRPEQVSEQELTTLAFGLLQRRITEQVSAIHPQARWTWAAPGARERFASGGPLLILLNGAGGLPKGNRTSKRLEILQPVLFAAKWCTGVGTGAGKAAGAACPA